MQRPAAFPACLMAAVAACSLAACSVAAPARPEDTKSGENDASEAAQSDFWSTIEITATPLGGSGPDGAPVPLTVGKLRYAGGAVLTSPDKRFGGFSGLRLLPGQKLLALSDRAAWLVARYEMTDHGAITGLRDAGMAPVTGADGAALSGAEGDTESLELLPGGAGLVVGFERRHRLDAYTGPADGEIAYTRTLFGGEVVAALPGNGSLESVVALSGDSLLTIAEDAPYDGPLRPAWIRTGDGWQELAYRPANRFAVTDMAHDPATGDVYAVERAFSPLRGVRARITRFAGATAVPGAVIEPEELARLNAFHGIDNMEGLDVLRQPDGSLRLYLISDDNFNVAQRTVLMSWAVTDRPARD